LFHPELSPAHTLSLCAVVSAAGAAAELFSQRLDDNFTIPVIAGGVAAFWF
ncbi:MAG: hypothetical protein JRI97_09450, partial [Deltaproteobacteria bacterium]|nr:hypothetical protein [Deltaproteobacteria bacterium]